MPKVRATKPLRENDYKFHGPPDHWVLSDWFCPSCGMKDMWQRSKGGGDYYHDYSVTCHSCGYEMCCVGNVDAE